MKEVTKYYSDATGREATVFLYEEQKYIAQLMIDSGSIFSASFTDVEEAKKFSERWVNDD